MLNANRIKHFDINKNNLKEYEVSVKKFIHSTLTIATVLYNTHFEGIKNKQLLFKGLWINFNKFSLYLF